MKIDELVNKLDELGVSRSEYSIGKEEEQKYCLIKDTNVNSYNFYFLEKPQKRIAKLSFFKTIYEEYKGFKSLHKWFDTEEEVCAFFYDFFARNKFIDTNWKYVKTISDVEKFDIKGVNIWDYDWKDTNRIINIRDPQHEQSYLIEVYEIDTGKVKIEFAITEFSNGAWGVCIPNYLED